MMQHPPDIIPKFCSCSTKENNAWSWTPTFKIFSYQKTMDRWVSRHATVIKCHL